MQALIDALNKKNIGKINDLLKDPAAINYIYENFANLDFKALGIFDIDNFHDSDIRSIIYALLPIPAFKNELEKHEALALRVYLHGRMYEDYEKLILGLKDRAVAASDNNAALIHFSAFGDLKMVKQLLAIPAVLQQAKALENMALIAAARNDHYEIVQELIDKKTNLENTERLIQMAAIMGNKYLLDILLKERFYIEKVNYNANWALCSAVQKGHIDICKKLLTYENVLNIKKSNLNLFGHAEALRDALDKKRYDILDLLLNHSCFSDNPHNMKMLVNDKYWDNEDRVKKLMNGNPSRFIENVKKAFKGNGLEIGKTLLMRAVVHDYADIVEELVQSEYVAFCLKNDTDLEFLNIALRIWDLAIRKRDLKIISSLLPHYDLSRIKPKIVSLCKNIKGDMSDEATKIRTYIFSEVMPDSDSPHLCTAFIEHHNLPAFTEDQTINDATWTDYLLEQSIMCTDAAKKSTMVECLKKALIARVNSNERSSTPSFFNLMYFEFLLAITDNGENKQLSIYNDNAVGQAEAALLCQTLQETMFKKHNLKICEADYVLIKYWIADLCNGNQTHYVSAASTLNKKISKKLLEKRLTYSYEVAYAGTAAAAAIGTLIGFACCICGNMPVSRGLYIGAAVTAAGILMLYAAGGYKGDPIVQPNDPVQAIALKGVVA